MTPGPKAGRLDLSTTNPNIATMTFGHLTKVKSFHPVKVGIWRHLFGYDHLTLPARGDEKKHGLR
jgi:hypothetical protein